MSFCDKLCIHCEKKGKLYLNYSKYHRVCKIHYKSLYNQPFTQCKHCNSQLAICKSFVYCYSCGQDTIKVALQCSHSPCKSCMPTTVSTCQTCETKICLICTNSKKTCEKCSFCQNCQQEFKVCKHCPQLVCVCYSSDQVCRSCETITCKNCRKFDCGESIMSECGHLKCGNCILEAFCRFCTEGKKYCGRCKELKSKCDECTKQICRNCRQRGLCRTCEPKSVRSMRGLIKNSCTKCKKEVPEVLQSKESGDRLRKDCSDNCFSTMPPKPKQQVCKCGRTAQIIRNDHEYYCNDCCIEKHGNLQDLNIKFSCSKCHKKNVGILKNRKCNHGFCSECFDKKSCILCTKTEKQESNDEFKAEEEKKLNQECTECRNPKGKKIPYRCGTIVCKNCSKNHPQCKGCCNKCTKHFGSGISKVKCNQLLCEECNKMHISNENCKICIERCGCCKEILNRNPVVAECGHQVCEKCNQNRYCLKCILETKKIPKDLTTLNSDCISCMVVRGTINLFCGHIICVECISGKYFNFSNYCCLPCSTNSNFQKNCLNCLEKCSLEMKNAILKKNCHCKNEFCLICKKIKEKKSGFFTKKCVHK